MVEEVTTLTKDKEEAKEALEAVFSQILDYVEKDGFKSLSFALVGKRNIVTRTLQIDGCNNYETLGAIEALKFDFNLYRAGMLE